MRPLTQLAHGSIPPDDENPRGVDPREVGLGRGYDGIETAFGTIDGLCSSLSRPLGVGRIRLHDDDLPARELERARMDAREAELEHAPGSVSEQLEDPRRRARGKGRRQPSHVQTLTFGDRGASRRG